MNEQTRWEEDFRGLQLRVQFNCLDSDGQDSVTGRSDGIDSTGSLVVVESNGNRYSVDRTLVERIYMLDGD